jgi:RNA recognition motif-containing protein
LFVANIPYSCTDETLQEVFKNYKVASAHVARMRK